MYITQNRVILMINGCTKNSFCELLDEETKKFLCQHVTITYQTPKQITNYLSQGNFQIVSEGVLLKYTLLEDGTQKSIDIIKAGELLGEHLLFDNIEYPEYSTMALTEVKICNYPIQMIRQLFNENRQFAYALTQSLTKRVTKNQTFWVKLHSLPGAEKVQLIYDTLKELDVDLQLITQEDLALMAGVSRITVARAMKNIQICTMKSSTMNTHPARK